MYLYHYTCREKHAYYVRMPGVILATPSLQNIRYFSFVK
jgi:hypothetical protein